jgi:transposase, IS5 family
LRLSLILVLDSIKKVIMRQRFEQQLSIDIPLISELKFPIKSRDELPPILRALQHIFVTPELSSEIFELLEEKICNGKKKTGRKGMNLWHILVLAVIRHGLNTNWDRLHHMVMYDRSVRNIMGILPYTEIEDFTYQTILDNVSLLDEELLMKINEIVVKAGHKLVKKKEDEALILKTDSYALETNVHFPTDLNLLWDSCRKSLDIVEKLSEHMVLKGWRKRKEVMKNLKRQFRSTTNIVYKGRKESAKRESVKKYLSLAIQLEQRCQSIIDEPAKQIEEGKEIKVSILLEELAMYNKYIRKFTDQINRRLLKGELIPASEKIYSIFEEHTEWITKGKLNRNVELGHLILITTDQHQYIVDYKIMIGEKDPSQVKPLIERLAKQFKNREVASHSFDKGFYSKDNLEILNNSKVAQVILPKKGKLNKEDKEREGTIAYKKLRNNHSAVESNINMLEHHGLDRCKDKGIYGYKRCVGLSILAYNLHIMGNKLKEQDKMEGLRKLKKAA